MTAKEPPLTDVLAWLLRSNNPTSHLLSRGLRLSYTPPNKDGRARLTLAREKVYPSDQEVYVVRRDLQAALAAADRHIGEFKIESWLRKGRWWYHTMEWVEYHQAGLFGENVLPS